ncbi:MAG: PLP-dependent transferase, partial [Verrucomicrobiales bacterium]|nr:PLP-dependent transferase [Verrucomicrobiales bacterium]
MRDLITNPAWRAEDLGAPLQDSRHAVSVAMPLWEHVVGYEEERPAVLRRLQCGYPRFFVHPRVRELFVAAEMKFARGGERCVVLPDLRVARRCIDFMGKRGVSGCRVVAYGWGQLAVVVLAEEAMRLALEFWRYTGEIVSSRQAEAALSGLSGDGGGEARQILRERLAGLAGQPVENVF